jgi:hypothetical protein
MVRSEANDYECLYSFATKMRLQGSADKRTTSGLNRNLPYLGAAVSPSSLSGVEYV